MRKPRTERNTIKLQKLIDEQKQSGNGNKYQVVQFKGIPKNINKRQGFKSSDVASQKSTRAK